MKFANVELWNEYVKANSGDPYTARIISYAQEWAELMEAQLDAPEPPTLESIAKATSNEADYDGITGFMYSSAAKILAQCWIHGEQLRRWHNLDVQFGTEGQEANEKGGILNTAVIVVSPLS